jgi:hypothetical protein
MNVPAFLRSRRGAALVVGGALAVAAGVGLVACGSDGSGGGDRAGAESSGVPQLSVVDPYIPQPAKQGTAAGYLTVRNDGDTADRLVAVSTSLTADATLHRTTETTMQKLDGIDIPAHGQGVLTRGGAHIMFEGTTRPLKKGDTVDVTLTFAKSAPITVQLPVLGAADRPGDPGTDPNGSGGADSEHSGHGG